jgi:hypothetical protein
MFESVTIPAGLPDVLSHRLLEVYRAGITGDLTCWLPCWFLLSRGLSPAVSCQEPGWVLRDKTHWNFVSYQWERGGSSALSV